MKTRLPALWRVAGMLFLASGLRDLVMPGFFSISPVAPTTAGAVVSLALGTFFLIFATRLATAKTLVPVSRD